MRISARSQRQKDCAHATTAHKRVHRSLSSLRLGFAVYSGRGRFFLTPTFVDAHSRPTVAVIEADATDRHTLCSLLRTLDVDVRVYESAESYLASRTDMLGCLITEVTLPGMSGLDLLRRLRAEGVTPPIILLGEEADVRAAVTAMREGAVDFIEKPRMDIAVLPRVAYLLDHGQTVRH